MRAPFQDFLTRPERVEGSAFLAPEQILTEQKIDLSGICDDPTPRRIILDGWFQRYEYYRPWRERIRTWLTFDPALHVPELKRDVVLSVRRTDFVSCGWALPFSYYQEAIETLKPEGGSVWIVTDDKHDPFFWRFAKWKPKYFSGTPQEDLLFLAKSPRLVISQSTFSWWPTFLGNVETIVCPIPAFGIWSGLDKYGGCSLVEEDRFLCLPCPEPYRPTKLEAAYHQMRILQRRIVRKLNPGDCNVPQDWAENPQLGWVGKSTEAA